MENKITLKKYLEYLGLSTTNELRYDLGYKLARIFDSKRLGEKERIEEDGLEVRIYDITFFDYKSVQKTILKSLK